MASSHRQATHPDHTLTPRGPREPIFPACPSRPGTAPRSRYGYVVELRLCVDTPASSSTSSRRGSMPQPPHWRVVSLAAAAPPPDPRSMQALPCRSITDHVEPAPSSGNGDVHQALAREELPVQPQRRLEHLRASAFQSGSIHGAASSRALGPSLPRYEREPAFSRGRHLATGEPAARPCPPPASRLPSRVLAEVDPLRQPLARQVGAQRAAIPTEADLVGDPVEIVDNETAEEVVVDRVVASAVHASALDADVARPLTLRRRGTPRRRPGRSGGRPGWPGSVRRRTSIARSRCRAAGTSAGG